MNFELFLAKRLSKTKLNSYYYSGPIIKICVLAICISTIIMLLTIGSGIGLKNAIRNNVVELTSEIQIANINTYTQNKPITLSNEIISKIYNIEKIINIHSIVSQSTIINNAEHIEGIILQGCDSEYISEKIKKHLINSSFFKWNDENEIIISSIQAQRLKLQIGDTCILYFLSNKNNIKKRKFVVTGIYQTNNQNFNDIYAFTQKSILQKIIKWEKNTVSSYEITLEKDTKVEKVVEKINHKIPYNLIAKSSKKRFNKIYNWINLFDKNILFILIIMCIICVINVTNALLILVLERLKMIGILKSYGCSNSSILKIFLYNSYKIIFTGLFLGNTITMIFYFIQKKTHIIKLNSESYFVNYLPLDININHIIIINIMIFIVTHVSLLAPYYIIKTFTPSNILKIK